jgi:DNA-binding FadR family transcriptional regulator
MDHLQPRPALLSPGSYAAVAEAIRRAIALGRYLPGERLPPERALAAELGVARATLREALRVLEGEGALAIRRGASGGAVVLPAALSVGDPGALREKAGEFEDLLDFRLAVEPAAARLAAQRRTEDEYLRLHAILDGMRLHTAMPHFRRGDSAFHLAIAEAARNARLRQAVEDGRVGMALPLDALDFAVMLAKALEGHRAILAAIAAGDAAWAERAMVAHIEDTRRELRLVLGLEAGIAAGRKG